MTYKDTTHPNHANAALNAFIKSSGGKYASDSEMVRDLICAALRLATEIPNTQTYLITDTTISEIAEKCGQQAIEDQADAVAGVLVHKVSA
jgi:hypothetical protein